MNHKLLTLLQDKINSSLTNYQTKISQIRASGANPAMLANLKVNYYETPTPLSQIANITSPDASLLLITPFDKSIALDILKALSDSNLELSGVEAAGIIRISVPPLTDEKRQFFVKQAKEVAEEARISIRTIRQDINKKIQNLDDTSENEQKILQDEVQKQVDSTNKEIEEIYKTKEQDLTQI